MVRSQDNESHLTNNSPDTISCGLSEEDLRMLAAMRAGLQAHVLPELSSEMAQTMCTFGVEYLDKLIFKYSRWPQTLRLQLQTQGRVCEGLLDLLAGAGVSDPAMDKSVKQLSQDLAVSESATLGELERLQKEIDRLLENLIPAVMGTRNSTREITSAQYNPLIKKLIASLRHSEDELQRTIQQQHQSHEKLTQGIIVITRDVLESYLKQNFGEHLEVTSFKELPGGSSKTTILIDVRGFEGEGETPIVVRMDRTAGSTDTRVLDEAPTLRAMAQQGLPVPEVLWEEPDASKIGLAFIGVRKVDAALGGSMWQTESSVCDRSTALDLARVLAKLHTLDVRQLALRGALNSDPDVHPMQGLIDNIRGLWREKKTKSDGILEACLCWLEQNMPPAPPTPSLIHADVSFHNILVKDKKIASLLDWELSHLGDPNEDLSYCRPCVEQLIPWDEFMAEYRRHGGSHYSEEIGRYYGIWRGVRNAVYTITAGHSFHTNANPDFRWGFFDTYYRMVLLEAADKVAEAGTD
jgi:aminoglycoside phosphotransferase (APT) family kinase protein